MNVKYKYCDMKMHCKLATFKYKVVDRKAQV